MSKKTLHSNTNSPETIVRNPVQLGTALLRFRKQNLFTQKEVGDRSGIKQSIVSQVELGTQGTRLGTLFKLLAALDLELVVRKRKKSSQAEDSWVAKG